METERGKKKKKTEEEDVVVHVVVAMSTLSRRPPAAARSPSSTADAPATRRLVPVPSQQDAARWGLVWSAAGSRHDDALRCAARRSAYGPHK